MSKNYIRNGYIRYRALPVVGSSTIPHNSAFSSLHSPGSHLKGTTDSYWFW